MIKHYKTAKNSGFQTVVTPIGQDKSTSTTTIQVDKDKRFQTILGFGGAFTEAAAYTLSRMSEANQQEILRAYFDPNEGLGYNIGRVAIHSCDFALENYTYIEDGDTTLSTFDIAREHRWVIPMIQEAERIAGQSIQLLASPWSPPAWMKTNNDMNHGGKLKPEYRDVWARYYVKFLDALKSEGLTPFAITVQNEPAAVQIWDSCIYTAEEERDFIKHHLGPVMKDHHPDIHIVIWDHNRDILVERGDTVLQDEEARAYVWGTGLHWYVSEAFENLTTLHNLHPDKHLIFTEGCIEGGVHLGAWHTGERYARNMIGDFRNYNEGYLDWNLVLDETGGPNHVGNFCDAPIICDTTTDTIHYESSYYYIGHFSRHIQVGAIRTESIGQSDTLQHVSFLNPDGSEVLVVLNETDETKHLHVRFTDEDAVIVLEPHSISTLVKRGE
jgi:glucosylceramidase